MYIFLCLEMINGFFWPTKMASLFKYMGLEKMRKVIYDNFENLEKGHGAGHKYHTKCVYL